MPVALKMKMTFEQPCIKYQGKKKKPILRLSNVYTEKNVHTQ